MSIACHTFVFISLWYHNQGMEISFVFYRCHTHCRKCHAWTNKKLTRFIFKNFYYRWRCRGVTRRYWSSCWPRWRRCCWAGGWRTGPSGRNGGRRWAGRIRGYVHQSWGRSPPKKFSECTMTSCLELNNRTSFENIKFVTQDIKVKHTNITTIYKDSWNGNYIQKQLKHQAGRLGCKEQMV